MCALLTSHSRVDVKAPRASQQYRRHSYIKLHFYRSRRCRVFHQLRNTYHNSCTSDAAHPHMAADQILINHHLVAVNTPPLSPSMQHGNDATSTTSGNDRIYRIDNCINTDHRHRSWHDLEPKRVTRPEEGDRHARRMGGIPRWSPRRGQIAQGSGCSAQKGQEEASKPAPAAHLRR